MGKRSSKKLELVSFVLCPFVQRAVIALNEKGVEYRLIYVDLDNPPEWFRRISPLGKVPLLLVGDQVLFESAIINEYLDETYLPRLHPSDLLQRAQERGWIEFASHLLSEQAALCQAGSETDFLERKVCLDSSLEHLQNAFRGGPYWRGADFSLVDTAYAPFFMRQQVLEADHPELADMLGSALAAWGRELLARPSVTDSVVSDFKERYRAFYADRGAWVFRKWASGGKT